MSLIQKMSAACARNIISIGRLQDINESILRYGCELILTSFFGLPILITLSLLIGHPFAWLFFVIGFAPHRTAAGGYHADTHMRCYIVTSSMFIIGATTAYGVVWNRYVYITVSLFSTLMVGSFAPLEAMNKPLSTKRFRTNRIRSLVIICLNCIIAVFFTMLNLVSEEANMYFSGIFFASASLIMGKIKNSLKGGNTNEG